MAAPAAPPPPPLSVRRRCGEVQVKANCTTQRFGSRSRRWDSGIPVPGFIKKYVIEMSAVDSLGLKTTTIGGGALISAAVVSEDEED